MTDATNKQGSTAISFKPAVPAEQASVASSEDTPVWGSHQLEGVTVQPSNTVPRLEPTNRQRRLARRVQERREKKR